MGGCVPSSMHTATIRDAFRTTRALTEALAAPLSAEDQTIQSMPDVSPTKWHRAHTTWFFETFVLGRFAPDHTPAEPLYRELFNSYYQGIGPQFTRAERGLLSRPSVAEVGEYRAIIDDALLALFDSHGEDPVMGDLIEFGVHHEQQHQELLLMDIKHVLSINPLRPTYRPTVIAPRPPRASGWVDVAGGTVEIGTAGAGFSFDNEQPRHAVHIYPFALADRLVTAGEWIAFMADGGYERSELWLSDGWHAVQQYGWRAPLYWTDDTELGSGWHVHTLGGTRSVLDAEPVAHVSFFEADAYARWAGRRLPTEFEWEHAASTAPSTSARPFSLDELHPQPATGRDGALEQMFGECWQLTASAYLPYPGFEPAPGAVGEYNGKFMSGQMVLRGSSAFTPPEHTRVAYRNFFPPHARWMLSGVRLADGGNP